jgi:putative Holliday junction resolvase|uniref:Putative pre-16S rRNA nuclease n=1 Tax=candidate division WOR-3 bacterium TaxID=2052148 RepID=A0A7V3VU94_UNCW3
MIMKVMAIDYGRMRVGIALTDPLGVIAQPYLTLRYKTIKDLIKRLKFICEENNVGLILVGNPLRMDGEESEISEEIKRFVERLKKTIKVETRLWDERFTSRLASRVLKDYGLRQKNLDQISASLMLEEYLKQSNGLKVEC